MLNSISTLFKQLVEGHDLSKRDNTDPNLAMACLLCEVASADHNISDTETQAQNSLLARLLDIDGAQAAELLARARMISSQSTSLYEFTSQLRELSQVARFDLIKSMWEVANADGVIDPLEDAVIRKTAELIYVDHSEFIRAKLQVLKSNE
ncbi:hypothetical protein GCM10007938_03700 [Vibrio zhanjiangensis]|uniref:Co-chaperone DjlA N-terminal domain-containing protein n=1 Tax=Vibrio zhanjiangensis TaxID=1046128 RepID=A0ABQ6EUX1_9VIBR|nr:TerB family tellurite resistance protein [Vibrio zhanjiangensis]GLT16594.1 hypothetical protein GCM10007938_03700 [Vibrio zhanjiangensis]